MTAIDLIHDLRRRGVELRADGERLRFRPVSAVGPDLRLTLAANKADIIAALLAEQVQPSKSSPLSQSARSSRVALRYELAGIVRTARRQGDRQTAADALEAFNHRAGVMQFDGGLVRKKSERCALLGVLPGIRAINAEPVTLRASGEAGPGGGLFGNAANDDAAAWARN